MKSSVIAFYSHIPCLKTSNDIYTSSFIGIYIDELAYNCKKLILIAHVDHNKNFKSEYVLKSTNIVFINIGEKKSAPSRMFFGFNIYNKIKKIIPLVDYFLIRVPTPLAFWFSIIIPNSKLRLLVVADDQEAVKFMDNSGLRNKLIKMFLIFSNTVLNFLIKKTKTFVNSKSLHARYKKINPNVLITSTSLLRKDDYFKKSNFNVSKVVKLLFVGRIDLSKGIIETIGAVKILKKRGIECTYSIVGWDDNKKDKNKNKIKKIITQFNLSDNVKFLGKKNNGNELNKIYRDSDIFILASYYEGFPRVVLESMANSLPVIVSCVGSIPYEFSNNNEAIIINIKSSHEISNAVIRLINDIELRKKIVRNAYSYSLKKDLSKNVKKLINSI